MRTDDGEAGFTLLEALVAAALFALLMLLAGQGVSLTLDRWREVGERASAERRVAVAHALVRRLVAEAWPLVLRDREGRLSVAFSGESHRLRLVALAPLGSGMQTAFELHLAGNRLEVVRSALDPALKAPFLALEQGTATVLLEGVAGGSFAYFGSDRPGVPPAWHSAWTGETGPPLLVRIHLSFPANDPRLWPDLLAAPKAEPPVAF